MYYEMKCKFSCGFSKLNWKVLPVNAHSLPSAINAISEENVMMH